MPPKTLDGSDPRRAPRRSAAAGAGGGPGTAQQGLLRGPRQPRWGCGGCGEDANWACRTQCRACGKAAPRTVAERAKQADALWYAKRAQGEASAAAARPRQAPAPKQQQRQVPGKPRKQPPHPPGPRTFAEVVMDLGIIDDDADQASDAGGGAGDRVEHLLELRYWRERRQAALRAKEFGKADLEQCDAKLEELAQAEREARPWAHRVQAASQKYARAVAQADRAQADVETARKVLTNLEMVLAAAKEEQATAEAELAKVKAQARPEAMAVDHQSVEAAVEALRLAVGLAGMDLGQVLAAVVAKPVSAAEGAMAPTPPAAEQPDAGRAALHMPAPATPAMRPPPLTQDTIPPGQRTPATERSRSTGRKEDDASSVASGRRGATRGRR